MLFNSSTWRMVKSKIEKKVRISCIETLCNIVITSHNDQTIG